MSELPPLPGAPVPVPVAARLRPVTIPVLVSALANVVAGYLWFSGSCLGIFVTAPMLVLGAFEFIYFAQAPKMPPADLQRRTAALGIFEIILGIFNGVSLACGIVVLINLNRVRAGLAEEIAVDPNN